MLCFKFVIVVLLVLGFIVIKIIELLFFDYLDFWCFEFVFIFINSIENGFVFLIVWFFDLVSLKFLKVLDNLLVEKL